MKTEMPRTISVGIESEEPYIGWNNNFVGKNIQYINTDTLVKELKAMKQGDYAENAYWLFDVSVKGLGPWKGMPQSERDAFKEEINATIDAAIRKVKGEK